MHRSLSLLPLVLLTGACGGGCVIGPGFSGHFTMGGIRLDEEVRREEAPALELAPGDTLTLDSSSGDIRVDVSSDGRSELHATLRARGRTQAEAEAALARYELRLERGPNGPTARLVGEPLHIHEGSTRLDLAAYVDYVALVPAGTPLCASTGSGDIRARGELGTARLETSYGTITVEGTRGEVSAKSGSGDVSGVRLEGAEITLESGYGAVSLEGVVAQHVLCKSGSGDVELGNARADEATLSTSYGAVHVRDSSGAIHAQSGSGDVRLHGVAGAIEAESSYGSIEIEGVLAALEAKTGSGDLSVHARTGSSIAPSWALSSSYGEVVLRVPEGFACQLDARTSYGTVECDFPVTIEAGKKKGDNKLKGTVGGGGGTVTLSSGSGNVALKKL